MIGNLEEAMHAYEQALRHNQYSIPAMNQISAILRTREQFPKAIEYLQAILKIDGNNGEVWGSLGNVPSILTATGAIANTIFDRSLLSYDGELARSLYRISTSSISFKRSCGTLYS